MGVILGICCLIFIIFYPICSIIAMYKEKLKEDPDLTFFRFSIEEIKEEFKNSSGVADLMKHPFVQKSINPDGEFYPKSMTAFKEKLNTLTSVQKNACIRQFLNLIVCQQVSAHDHGSILFIVVSDWFGIKYSDNVAFFTKSGELTTYNGSLLISLNTKQIFDDIDSISDEETKEIILRVSCEIACMSQDKAKKIETAIGPFKQKWSKVRIFNILSEPCYDVTFAKNVTGWQKAFADFWKLPDSVSYYSIKVNPENRNELINSNDGSLFSIQPQCGEILQLTVSKQNQLLILGTKGLQTFENFQFVDVIKGDNGKDIVKNADNPIVYMEADDEGNIYAFYKDGGKVLLKAALKPLEE